MVSDAVRTMMVRGMTFLDRPYPLFLFGFILSVVYVPGWVGASISTGWLFLLIVMSVAIWFFKIPITNSHIYGFLFLIYASISLAWTQNFNLAFFELLKLIVLGLIFCFGSYVKDIKFVIKGLCLGLLISDFVAFQQYFFDNHTIYSTGNGAAGLFVNVNMFCEISAILLVALIVLKLYWWIPVTLPALFLIHSRSAILALIVCSILWVWSKSKIAAASIIPVIVIIIYEYVLYGHFDFSSIRERTNVWLDTINGLTFFGNGVGSYEIMYPLYATHIDTMIARPKYAHNDLLQIVFEFGIGSIFCLIFLWNVFKINCKERYILYVVAIISLFSFPTHIPVSAFIFCLVAGFVTRYNVPNGNIRNYRRSILSDRIKNF